ncbi:lysyl oxidase homolog 2B [Plodia interpunctella]|uniref:lysyl oxidase homolog 2B n=1 Tax=Plodia interpunctella TaxID=58824 RepID=UPI0023687DA4|nr:lysyl oxidase homolog 2B [Plodia interpunctella]
MLVKMFVVKVIALLVLIIVNVCELSKEVVRVVDQRQRAHFIQRLMNRRMKHEGKIKLIGGPTMYEGNVYIYHAGRWGAVCDDSWDDTDAQVVCRYFNRTGIATRGGEYGVAKTKFWMDDVVCQGDEKYLFECIFSGWGSSDCSATEAAGVNCNKRPSKYEQKDHFEHKLMLKKQNVPLKLVGTILRLVPSRNYVSNRNARSHSRGRVELFYNKTWGSICPDGWTLYEAMVVCRHLGLGYALEAMHTDYFGSSPIMLTNVKCQGNESNIFECKVKYGESDCPGDVGHVAAISCTEQLADLQLDTNALEISAHLEDVPMYMLQCAMEENCLSKSAYKVQDVNPDWHFDTRRLLRFTASTLNKGTDEFRPYLPKHMWQWHLCHMHYHSMEVFATFDILDGKGRRVAEGHKASFCLEDNTCLPGVERKFSCKNYGDQGISVNCSDVYLYNIDCQWVDVSDVEPGDYTFKVAVNPHAKIAEQSFHNNAAICQLRLTGTYARVYGCVLTRP